MAMTIPQLGKALEDLTKAFTNGKVDSLEFKAQVQEMSLKLQGNKAVINVEDFITGSAEEEIKTDITPKSLKDISQETTGKEPFIITADELGIFENGKRYCVSADFKALSYNLPPFVRALCLRGEKELASDEKPLTPSLTRGFITLNFVYEKPPVNENVLLQFTVGSLSGGQSGDVEWSNFKIEKITKGFSEKQKQAAQVALDDFLSKAEQYTNVIRNKNGSIVVPDAVDDRDAVNLKTVDEKITQKVAGEIESLTEKIKNELKTYADARLIAVLEKGYIQWPGMASPKESPELQFEGYQWVEVNYDGNFFRAKGRLAKAFSDKNLTKDNVKNGEYIFSNDEQDDTIRNITGEVGVNEGDSVAAWSNNKTNNGALFSDKNFRSWSMGQGVSNMYYKNLKFDASKVVPTADENRPRNPISIWKLVKK